MEFVNYDNEEISILSEFPVGYVLITTTNTNPGNFTAGTWEAFGTGRTIVGIDTSQTEFNNVLKTGGSKTHTLTSTEMPSHTHTQSSHTHTATTSSTGSHSHTITINTAGSHNHGVSVGSSGDHAHDVIVFGYGRSVSLNSGTDNSYQMSYTASQANYASGRLYTQTGGSHTHAISVNSSGIHNHTASSNSTGAHTHALTTSSSTPTINSTGGNGSHNNLQPYITVYMWRRTA